MFEQRYPVRRSLGFSSLRPRSGGQMIPRQGPGCHVGPDLPSHLSPYLDLMRFSAAAIVFGSHFGSWRLTGGLFWQLAPYGHSAVIVFFVLSGFVIAWTAERKDRSGQDYLLSRASRVLSVAWPAIALTV